jgi:formylglycine-generating enzyme required for sulfatase activity
MTPSPDTGEQEFLPIRTGSYTVPEYLWKYVRFYFEDTQSAQYEVTITESFAIQTHEVTVHEFQAYVNSLEPGNSDKKRLRDILKTQDAQAPIQNITWHDAVAYANWLSIEKQQNYRLPMVKEWIAALVEYADDEVDKRKGGPVLDRADCTSLTGSRYEIDHLLGNVREWSADACQSGEYWLLGEHCLTLKEDIGRGFCSESDRSWMFVGFRLVRVGD